MSVNFSFCLWYVFYNKRNTLEELTMTAEKITLQQIREEVEDMFATCFEGEMIEDRGELILTLRNGQRFRIAIEEA